MIKRSITGAHPSSLCSYNLNEVPDFFYGLSKLSDKHLGEVTEVNNLMTGLSVPPPFFYLKTLTSKVEVALSAFKAGSPASLTSLSAVLVPTVTEMNGFNSGC